MVKKQTTKREAETAKLYQDFGVPKLVAVMGQIIQHRRERAGLAPDFRLGGSEDDIRKMLDEFLHDASKRQLKLLREIAKGTWAEEVTEAEQAELEAALDTAILAGLLRRPSDRRP